MKVLGIQVGHNSSVCLYDDNKLIYYNQEERLSKLKKFGGLPTCCLEQVKNIAPKVDVAIATGYDPIYISSLVADQLYKLKIIEKYKLVYYLFNSHHLMHATKSYFSSGFKDATIFVIDGRGSQYIMNDGTTGYETSSVFTINYPNEFKTIFKTIYKKIETGKVHPVFENRLPTIDSDTIFKIQSFHDLGHFYSAVCTYFGWNNEEGKLMGLSAYGKSNSQIKKMMSQNDFIEKHSINNKYIINEKEDLAFETQNYFENNFLKLVDKYKDLNKNIIISGGTGLNVVNNYKLKKYFKNNNIYVDPLCGDEGNSIAACQHYLYRSQKNDNFEKVKSLYLGPTYDFKITENIKNSSTEEVVQLLTKNEIVALYQNKAEAGPRALGNRSLLMNPSIVNGKNIMNTLKGREFFRPLACCVLEEHASEWFDMDYSPDMMYAAQAKDKTKKLAPSIVHVDNTCRIQTVNKNQNPKLYEILHLFNKQTNIPILMNTSFNLKGQPIVETPEDAVSVLKNSKFKYVFFANENKLLTIY